MLTYKIMLDSLQIGESSWQIIDHETIELLDIRIDINYRNMGHGTAFLNKLIHNKANNQFSVYKKIWLEVRASNIAAIKVYTNIGFNIVGRRKNYYPVYNNKIISNKEDAILMELQHNE
jgi:[ribosomal protein S18]-alanine N-acetyltransferase